MNPVPSPEDKAQRVSVPEIDAILGKHFRVLDDGFVRVVDYLGSDQSVVQAARVSYGLGTKTVQDDRGLIRYLMRHRHTTPFEMCEIKLHVRVPMHVWRQWIRHRTANVNEYSTRYSIAIDSMEKTHPDRWRLQKKSNRQGSEGFLPLETGAKLSALEVKLQRISRKVYEKRLALGVSREQARKDLLLSTYTEAYWKIDLWNLFHFLMLRMAENAQEEIQAYAKTIGYEIVSKWAPHSWEAFLDFNVNALWLSSIETRIVELMLNGSIESAKNVMKDHGWLEWDDRKQELRKNREREEFLHKLKTRFGFSLSLIDWPRH